MGYIWVSLRTWGVYVNVNHNIITYITKKSSIYNVGIIINTQNLQNKTKYKTNDLKFATSKSKHLKVIFIHFMGLRNGHLVEGCNSSKH
jgi:hypothetical protein